MNDSIIDKLQKFLSGNYAILGIGNTLRSDDGLGTIIAEKLREHFKNSRLENTIFIGGVAPENILGKIAKMNIEKLLILDAVMFDGAPGEIKIFSVDELAAPMMLTHGPSNFAMMKMILPKTELSILAVQPKINKFGNNISEAVKNSIADVFDSLIEIISRKK